MYYLEIIFVHVRYFNMLYMNCESSGRSVGWLVGRGKVVVLECVVVCGSDDWDLRVKLCLFIITSNLHTNPRALIAIYQRS